MAIVQNQPCPWCRETGHDKTGNHLMVFSDGNRMCNKTEYHANGKALFIPADGDDPILDMEVDGSMKYTPEQFNELVSNGKLDSESMRAIALAGMRGEDRWSVATPEEKELILEDVAREENYYNSVLRVRNLKDRHIKGEYCKFYGLKVGLDENNKPDRHYYPAYNDDGSWRGAWCRSLPKDFTQGHLGHVWGDYMLAGQNTIKAVLDSGRRMDSVVITAGFLDMVSAQQMLCESQTGDWAGKYFHVWSVQKGEASLKELQHNKETLMKFKKIIFCFDNDEVGKELTKQAALMFKDKAFVLKMPSGCKDPNDCLRKGFEKEFVNAWFNPSLPFEGGNIRAASHYKAQAKKPLEMGLSYPFPSLDPVTYGIGLHRLNVWGGGTGCGKTTVARQIAFHLSDIHDKRLMVIFLENQPDEVVRAFAGFKINKDLCAPACNDTSDPHYEVMRDYTLEEADKAIDDFCDEGKIYIGDLEGKKDVDSVMELLEEAIAMGYQYFLVDNLTAFEHKGKNGKSASKVEAIDETMRRLGTLKDENPIHIDLLSHLNRPRDGRKGHEVGGEIELGDFRGSGSISFWANAVFGIERNTKAATLEERCLTCIRAVKSRDVGHKTGTCVYAKKSLETGVLSECNAPPPKKENGKRDGYNYGKGSGKTDTEF